MHRTGLWHNRYNIFTEPAGRLRERSQPVQNAKKELEAKQEELKKSLAAKHPGLENELAYNYMALQIFDLLSLYFCCDGYAADNQFKEYAIAPVRVSYDSDETVRLTIRPNGAGSVIMDPYPFDVSPVQFSARARIIAAAEGKIRGGLRRGLPQSGKAVVDVRSIGVMANGLRLLHRRRGGFETRPYIFAPLRSLWSIRQSNSQSS